MGTEWIIRGPMSIGSRGRFDPIRHHAGSDSVDRVAQAEGATGISDSQLRSGSARNAGSFASVDRVARAEGGDGHLRLASSIRCDEHRCEGEAFECLDRSVEWNECRQLSRGDLLWDLRRYAELFGDEAHESTQADVIRVHAGLLHRREECACGWSGDAEGQYILGVTRA